MDRLTLNRRTVMWLAQTMRVFFVGDVDTAARLADAVKLPEQHLGTVENLQRMSAGHKVKLIVSQQHLGSVAIGILYPLQIEVGRDPASIFEAARGMIQRDKACRFKFPLNQSREITNSATDIRDDKTAAQAVARQQFTFVPPCPRVSRGSTSSLIAVLSSAFVALALLSTIVLKRPFLSPYQR